MYVDQVIKLINKAVDSLEYTVPDLNHSFEYPEKALVLLPGFLGDILLLTPILRNLKYNFGPKSLIDTVSHKSHQNMLETLNFINNLYWYDIDTCNKAEFLKNKNYDTVFLFNYSILWAFECHRSKIKQVVSFSLDKIGLNNPPLWLDFNTHLVKSISIYDKKPQSQAYFNILKDLGLEIFDQHLEINLTENDISKSQILMENITYPRILVHVTAGSPGKAWNIKNWITVIKYLKEKFNCSFISTGIENEKKIYDYLAEKTGAKFINLCGETTLRETVALYRYLDLVITLDTAPAHFAAYSGAKNIIIIYGPTNQNQWAPVTETSNVYQVYLDLSCRPCISRICHNRNCLTKLSPDTVINVIDSINL